MRTHRFDQYVTVDQIEDGIRHALRRYELDESRAGELVKALIADGRIAEARDLYAGGGAEGVESFALEAFRSLPPG